MRTSRVILSLVAIVVLFVACNGAVTAALEVYGTSSAVIWQQYAEQDDIDTLIVGTSYSEHALDPTALAAHGVPGCFNLSSPSQTLQDSLLAIQTAYEDHGISRVILNVNSFSAEEDDEVDMGGVFFRQRNARVSATRALSAWLNLAFNKGGIASETSINMLFPWENNHVGLSPSAIMSNLRMRLGGDLIKAAEVNDPGRVFYPLGYSNKDWVSDYNSDDITSYFPKPADGVWKPPATKVDSLREICAYCADQGIELLVIGVPMPPFAVLDYGDYYYDQQAAIQSVLDEFGLTYYDFSMARPELFKTSHDYYFFISHLNAAGGAAFSESFAKFLGELYGGNNVEKLFFDREGYEQSIDYIDALLIDVSIADGGVLIEGSAQAGTGVVPEYRMSVQDESGAYAVVRDYDLESTFTYVPAKRGTVRVKVETREAGSTADYEYYREAAILY